MQAVCKFTVSIPLTAGVGTNGVGGGGTGL